VAISHIHLQGEEMKVRSSSIRVVAGAAVLLLATACGSSGGSSAGGNSASSKVDTAAIDKMAAGYDTKPPADSPPPAKGKSVWWISCGQAIPSCSDTAAGAQEAAKAIGWDFHIADGKLNIPDYTAAIRTALAANADAIMVSGFNCPQVKGAIQDAVSQGVKIIGPDGFDCNSVPGGPKLYNVDMIPAQKVPSVDAYWRNRGVRSADYIMAKSGGQAKIIFNRGHDVPLHQVINEGFLSEIKKCKGCEIVDTVDFDTSGFTPEGPWIKDFRTALVKHPEATATFMPFDLMMSSLGGAQAVKEANSQAMIVGGSTDIDTIDLLRAGKITAITSAFDEAWVGWGAIDELNRAFNKKPSVPEGIDFKIMDANHNLPKTAGTNYQAEFDFRSAYKKAWGVN
jgi:ribose transport system substrate-binding protein